MPANAIMIQGTGSHVGKSLITSALCRIFAQDGHRVLPFKSQNMSNNAYVTKDQGEIGRAQAEQAKACGVEPSVLMNPILLKPTTDIGAQVIVLGKAVGTMTAREYHAATPQWLPVVTRALQQLREEADILVIEGAGSPAEINLKAHDFVNMWVAKQAQAKVLLVGDIDRGGVFAQLVGTMELLDDEERRLVRGFLINKFRGDIRLLESGIEWLEARYGLPVVGTLPYLHDVELLEEDSINVSSQRVSPPEILRSKISIEVVRVPRISNFTDFDPLAREPDVEMAFIDRPSTSLPDCLILPGSKSTIADLAMLRDRGFESYLHRCARAGREIVGVCGGFQMLGERILDPDRLEASVSAAPGLGMLPVVTVFENEKIVSQTKGIHIASELPVSGYEIHMGRMHPTPHTRSVLKLTERSGASIESYDGAENEDGTVWGTHLHGLFDAEPFRRWWLNRLRRRRGLSPVAAGTTPSGEDAYDRLAHALRPHLDMDTIYSFFPDH